MSRKPLSKAEKSLIFAAIPLAAVVFVVVWRGGEPKWNIPPAAPRPTPNGYDFYINAANATVRFTPEVDAASDSKSQPPGSAYASQNYSLARRQAWLKANSKMFALVAQGLKTPSMAPDAGGTGFGMATNSDWGKLRQLARDMSARTRTFQLQGQPMRATMSALDVFQMGQDATREGGFLPRLVGLAVESIGRDPLEDWNKTINALSADEAKIAARRLENLLAREPKASRTLTQDKRDCLLELRRMMTTAQWRALAALQNGGKTARYTSYFFASKKQLAQNYTGALDKGIAGADLPYSQLRVGPAPGSLAFYDAPNKPSPNRFGLIEVRGRASNTMLLLRLALRAYIAQNKVAPPTLSALAPTYLKTIPTDVYNDGKPLFYQAKGATYKLWSVGPDMKNDGGVPLSRKRGDKPNRPTQNRLDNTGDFVAGMCR